MYFVNIKITNYLRISGAI